MFSSDAYYLTKMDECRQRAVKASNPIDKKEWLKLAAVWLALLQLRDHVRPEWSPHVNKREHTDKHHDRNEIDPRHAPEF